MQEILKTLWYSLGSTLNVHLGDPATFARYVENDVWIVADDVNGFALYTDSEVASIFPGANLES